MKRYYDFIVQCTDRKTEYLLNNQVIDRERPDYGSLNNDFLDVKPTVYICTTAASAYFNPKSRFYYNDLVRDRISIAMDFIARFQRDDGSFDLASCNFKSAPDTAFIIKRMSYTYKLIKKYDVNGSFKIVEDKICGIVCSAVNALISGGFHTPNHRWAIAAALAACSNIVNDDSVKQRCLDRIEDYFVEPVDSMDDGEYSERSSGNYNAVVNAAMIMLYEEMKDPGFLEYVDKNLKFMLMMIDADGTIFTENSLRQDRGRREYAVKYFYQYLFMARKSKNNAGVFNSAAHKIIRDAVERQDYSVDCLYMLMVYEWMADIELGESALPHEYNKYFPYSGLVRVKKGDITYSLLKNDENFLFFQNGSVRLGMRIVVNYFQHRYFKAEEIDRSGDSYIMRFRADGWYYLPFRESPGTNDWWKMDNRSRELIVNNHTEFTVKVTDVDDGIDVTIKTSGIDRIPVRVEISLPSGGRIYSDNFALEANDGNWMILKNGGLRYVKSSKCFTISGGFYAHEFIQGGYSGSPDKFGYTVYMTDYTNFERKISIRAK
ncbi:MAG: hypothetical protein GX213_13650 [Clostridiaceae bacterium]|nr:hypothetical protein [Clostridiaceae bacterium]